MTGSMEGRVRVIGTDIHIDNRSGFLAKPVSLEPVFELGKPAPEIRIFENDVLLRSYRMEPAAANPDLSGQFLHSSIRIFENSGVMIDGIVSRHGTTVPQPSDPLFEGIRFQPFFLSDKEDANRGLKGRGLFARGLHFSGNITPTTIRNVCNCDDCSASFSLQHFHAGFSELQYFYSGDGSETLVIPYGSIPDLPAQLQAPPAGASLVELEARLPKPGRGTGAFRYYNSFRCPHCGAPFIDFEKYPEMRPNEYYGNTFLNAPLTRWKD